MKHTDERFAGTLYYFYDFTLATCAFGLFSCDCHTYDVTVERPTGLGCLDKDIILFTLRYDECKPFTGHLYLSCNLWKDLLSTLSSSAAALAASSMRIFPS